MAEPLGLLDIFAPQEDNGLLDPRRAAAAGLFAGLTNFGAQLAAAGAPRVGQPGPGWGGGLAAAGPAFSQAYQQGQQNYMQQGMLNQEVGRQRMASRIFGDTPNEQLTDRERVIRSGMPESMRNAYSLLDPRSQATALVDALKQQQQASQFREMMAAAGFGMPGAAPSATAAPAAVPVQATPAGRSMVPAAAPVMDGTDAATDASRVRYGSIPGRPPEGATYREPEWAAGLPPATGRIANLNPAAVQPPAPAAAAPVAPVTPSGSGVPTPQQIAALTVAGMASGNTHLLAGLPTLATLATQGNQLSESTVVIGGVPTVVLRDPRGNIARVLGPAASSVQDPNWQEWNRLNALGERRTAEQQRQFEALGQSLTRSLVDQRAPAAFDSERGKTLATEETGIRAAGTRASATLMRIGAIERALTGGFTTGAGSETAITAGQLAQRLGVPESVLGTVGLSANQTAQGEQIRAMASTLITGMLGSGGFPSQNFSNADREMLERSLPSLQNSVEGNRALVGIMRAMAERDRDIARSWSDYRRQHGTSADSFDKWSLEVLPGLSGRDVLAPIISQAFPNGVPQAAAPAPTARPQAVVPGPNGGAASPPPNIPAPPQGFRIVR